MGKSAGFRLLELVVVLVLVLFIVVVIFALNRPPEPRTGVRCISNVNSIGKGMAMYAEDPVHGGVWPWFDGNKWDTPTGTHRKDPYPTASDPQDRAITELLFMLARRSSVSVDQFICPSREGTEKFTDCVLRDEGQDYDFANSRNVSYSYAAPIRVTKAEREERARWLAAGRYTPDPDDPPGDTWENGVDPKCISPASMAVLADKSPIMDGGSCGPWRDKVSEKERKSWLSRNHDGDAINVLYMDYHVSRSNRADVGIANDCIYTVGGKTGPSRTATSSKLDDHRIASDSFLVGPY